MHQAKKRLQGQVKLHPKGFGLLLTSRRNFPIVLPPKNLWGLMEGDIILAKIIKKKYRHFHAQAEVLKILKRKQSHVIGIYQKKTSKEGWIQSSRFLWKGTFVVKQTSNLNGQWVLVRIKSYPTPPKKTFEGHIEEVLGKKLTAKKDALRVAIEHQLSRDFSQEIKQQTKFLQTDKINEIKGRKNLEHLSFCTVDGETAKDFDDAIYIERKEVGFIVFVAIADVSAYINVDSLIDKEAYERGTSVYFTNTCLPMLPPILSENLCSLMPKKRRLVLVAEIHFHTSGEVYRCQFYPASIKKSCTFNLYRSSRPLRQKRGR